MKRFEKVFLLVINLRNLLFLNFGLLILITLNICSLFLFYPFSELTMSSDIHRFSKL